MNPKIILVALCLFASLASAQEASSPLKQFEGKTLILRHPLQRDSQKYDAQGNVLTKGDEGSWTVYGCLLIDHIAVTQETLRVEGRRIFFLFPKQKLTLFEFKRLKGNGSLPLSPSVNIEIQLEHPVDSENQALAVLKQVFALDTANVLKSVPDFWRTYLAAHHFGYDASQPKEAEFRWREQAGSKDEAVPAQSNTEGIAAGELPTLHIGADVKPPQAKQTAPPERSKIADYERYEGIVVLSVVVGTDGNIHNTRLLRPAGMGLDEIAQSTVQTWRFKPSTHKGQPVAVEMNVEVGFPPSAP